MSPRKSRLLRERTKTRQETRHAAAIVEAVSIALDERRTGNDQADFSPTSGFASTELAPGRWMPHDHRPIVGFAPSPKENHQ